MNFFCKAQGSVNGTSPKWGIRGGSEGMEEGNRKNVRNKMCKCG